MIRLTADFSKPVRPMGKQNGTNNGPLLAFTDETEGFKEMGIDFVRFHETHSPFAKCGDVPFIFRDFDADENDPANYYFGETDAALKAAYDMGCEMMYRFGMGTENTKYPTLYCGIPRDYEKWARICINILRHYNEGWADGFHYGIRYVEIWNEADITPYWRGDRNEFTRFYCTTAKLIKAYNPDLLIGNAGWATPYYEVPKPDCADTHMNRNAVEEIQRRVDFFHGFLQTVIREEVPLDFYAWHFYGKNSAAAKSRLLEVEKMRKHYHLTAENINTEWSCVHLHKDSQGLWERAQRDTMKSAIGVLACMIVFQNGGVTKSMYFEADPWNEFFGGLLDFTHKPRNHYYSFKVIKMLREAETECETTGETDHVRICAAGNGEKHIVAITCEEEDHEISLKPLGIGPCKVRWWLFDETHKLVPIRTGKFCGRAMPLKLKANSAVVCEFLPE